MKRYYNQPSSAIVRCWFGFYQRWRVLRPTAYRYEEIDQDIVGEELELAL
jgi:hypothetical protein